MRAAFSVWDHSLYTEAVWPDVHDLRHGTVPGMRNLPRYASLSDAEYQKQRIGKAGVPHAVEGFDASSPLWDGVSPVFRALDIAYDQVCTCCSALAAARRAPGGRRLPS